MGLFEQIGEGPGKGPVGLVTVLVHHLVDDPAVLGRLPHQRLDLEPQVAEEGVAGAVGRQLEFGVFAGAQIEPLDKEAAVIARAQQVLAVVLDVLDELARQGGDKDAAVLGLQTVAGQAVGDLDEEEEVLLDHSQALGIVPVDEPLAMQADGLIDGDAPGDIGQGAGDLRQGSLGLVVVPVTLDSQGHASLLLVDDKSPPCWLG